MKENEDINYIIISSRVVFRNFNALPRVRTLTLKKVYRRFKVWVDKRKRSLVLVLDVACKYVDSVKFYFPYLLQTIPVSRSPQKLEKTRGFFVGKYSEPNESLDSEVLYRLVFCVGRKRRKETLKKNKHFGKKKRQAVRRELSSDKLARDLNHMCQTV